MTDVGLQAVRVAGVAGAIAVAALLQRLAPHARLRGSWRVNGGLWLVDAAVVGAVCGACGFTAARWAAAAGIGILNLLGVGRLAGMIPTLLFLDLVSYAWHRANHRVPVLWRLHQVHHSDPTFTVSTAARFHPGELLLSLPIRLAAVALIGAPVEAVLLFEVTFALANFVEHGDIDLPRPLEPAVARVLVTPALHRRHHTRRGPDRDTNFGTVFSFWDRVFRSYRHADSAAAIDTGLADLHDVTLARALLLPLRGPVG